MHQDRAEALFQQGFNCAQAVFVPFAEAQGLTFDQAMRLAASLGGGLGGSGEVCGAVLGLCMAQGLLEGPVTSDAAAKKAHNEKVKALVDAFRERFGQTGCDALRVPGDRSVCARFVRVAAALMEGK